MRKLGHELFCNLQTFVLWRARDISREQNETPVGHKPILSFGQGCQVNCNSLQLREDSGEVFLYCNRNTAFRQNAPRWHCILR